MESRIHGLSYVVCEEPRSSIRGTGLFTLHTWSRSYNADGKGFEPLRRGYRLLVFKTSSFGRSDNHPYAPETGILWQYRAAGHYEIISCDKLSVNRAPTMVLPAMRRTHESNY